MSKTGIEPYWYDARGNKMTAKKWYGGGFRGYAPPIEYGTLEKNKIFRVKDLWCSVWYTRFIGSEDECKKWIEKKHKEEAPMKVNYSVEKWDLKFPNPR